MLKNISFHKLLRFDGLWDTQRWFEPAFVALDAQGRVLSVTETAPDHTPAENIKGYVLPGHHNAHSHAFQYAMAGLAERLPPHSASDDFWSWRETMYNLAGAVSPEQMEDIAAMLYAEMIRHGYTAVAEFHYLHHDKDGQPYAEKATMGQALLRAAQKTGIKLTLIPIFYQRGGFDRPASPLQQRFLSQDPDDYLDLLEQSHALIATSPHAKLGVGIHSLRAASPEHLQAILRQAPPHLPRHIHVAEQQKEIQEVLQHLGQRPVAWMLQHLPIDERFHLVHATHMDHEEAQMLAKTGAHVVLCPSTEGNLGDGFFALREFMQAGGRWSIGTDSHIGLQPCEELRWLDYGQRLRHEKRNMYCFQSGDESGEIALRQAILHGRAATGHHETPLSVGQPFDAVIYNARMPLFAMAPPTQRLSAIVYTADVSSILGTMINGRWCAKDQQHLHQDALYEAFSRTLQALRDTP
ncbi:MAG: formimidoylglutamate deiminase [Myxococcales bacterium]|nr:formimidoylglutamate deiminase [Myxococcales bacterium]MCB9641496.1 formimidoylglutamate deiminase [Myxococcales bacterium]